MEFWLSAAGWTALGILIGIASPFIFLGVMSALETWFFGDDEPDDKP